MGKVQRPEKNTGAATLSRADALPRSPEIAVFTAAVFYPVAKWSKDLSG